MTRLYFSVHYKLFYISLILLSVCALAWLVLPFTMNVSEWWLVSLEVVFTIALTADIAWRVTIHGPVPFFKDWKNWLDLFVSVVCVGMVVAIFVIPSEYQGIDDLAALSLFIGRTLAQLLRLVVLMKNLQKTETSVIDLNDMSDAHQSEEKSGIVFFDKQLLSGESSNLNQDQSAC